MRAGLLLPLRRYKKKHAGGEASAPAAVNIRLWVVTATTRSSAVTAKNKMPATNKLLDL